jgi:putative copper export protein
VPDPGLIGEGAAKALLYVSLLQAVGASAVHWLLLPRTAGDSDAGLIASLDRSVALLGLLAAFLASVSTVLRVWTHTVAAFGFDGARSWDTLMLVAFRSRWGQSWKVQVIAAAAFTVASAATLWRRNFWPFATFACAGFTITVPLLGHGAGNPLRMAVHTAHILAAGVWLGSLAVVVLITIRKSNAIESAQSAQRIRLAILRRFSAVALPGAATVFAAGLILAWLYIGDISNLWRTSYGRLLAFKVGLAGGICVCGYLNWQRLRKLRGTSAPAVLFELALAALVSVVSGYLTEIAHP